MGAHSYFCGSFCYTCFLLERVLGLQHQNHIKPKVLTLTVRLLSAPINHYHPCANTASLTMATGLVVSLICILVSTNFRLPKSLSCPQEFLNVVNAAVPRLLRGLQNQQLDNCLPYGPNLDSARPTRRFRNGRIGKWSPSLPLFFQTFSQ